ncbi:MAG: hypothetical protein ABI867_28910 [Kofleriaceae bacterium]
MVRGAATTLPAANAPIDLDRPPFITQSFGPEGGVVRYYNFDVQPREPATLYRLRAGELDVVDAIPGDHGYSDFWRISQVEVPAGIARGSITSAAQIREAGYRVTMTAAIINCPIVPRGTTAREGGVATELAYRGAKVACLRFGAPLVPDGALVPTSPIYVTFARPAQFATEPAAPVQTHNVVFSVPGDLDYSPLWAVHVYDRSAFDRVHDAPSAVDAPVIDRNGPLVNCPIVYVAAKP